MNLYKTITLSQAADLIAVVGDKHTVLVQGEMGIGKSSILKMLRDRPEMKDAFFCYVDITTKQDVGDFAIPMIKDIDGNDVCRFAPHEEFGFHLKGRKVVMMLDEIGKAKGGVLNACLRLMQERQFGTNVLDGWIFATTNLTVEGIGDNVPPHARNRVIQVRVAKPTADEWIENYAIPYGINPVIIGTVRENLQMFASFEEYERPDQNEYINDPRTVRTAFVTARSMTAASTVYERTRVLGDDVMCHALAGTVGAPAMHAILTMDKMDRDLPTWGDIINDPSGTPVSQSAAAMCMVVARAVNRIDRSNIKAWMTYFMRLPRTAQALFARSVMSDKCPKRDVATTCVEFAQWSAANNHLFMHK